MAVTIKQTESAPDAYPDPPAGLSTSAAALEEGAIWQRIETYTAWRWSEREVTWIVDGCGAWCAPLAPVTISTVEIWQGDAWVAYTPSPSPLGGYYLPGGTFRIVGTVGDDDGDVPAVVLEAFKRLAEYMAADASEAGVSSSRVDIPDVSTKEVTRSPAWMARAMQNSGAGDLLRPYRRV